MGKYKKCLAVLCVLTVFLAAGIWRLVMDGKIAGAGGEAVLGKNLEEPFQKPGGYPLPCLYSKKL